MKISKLSLAAVVALGTLSTGAFAGDLGEMVKGVDFSGHVRYRFRHETTDAANSDVTERGRHLWRARVKAKTPEKDNLQLTWESQYLNEAEGSSSSRTAVASASETGSSDLGNTTTTAGSYGTRQVYATWTPESTKTTVYIGKKVIGHYATDDMVGNGVWAFNSDIDKWTFAAVYVDNLQADGDFAASGLTVANTNNTGGSRTLLQSNVYTVAAIANYGMFGGQYWFTLIPDAIDAHHVVQLDFSYENFGLSGQYLYTSFDEDFKTFNNVDETYTWGIKGTAKFDPVSIEVAYNQSEVDDEKVGLTTIEDDVNIFSNFGERSNSVSNVISAGGDEISQWGGAISSKIPQVSGLSVGLDYVNTQQDSATAGVADIVDQQEWVGRVAYKYNSNWKFSSYYSMRDDGTVADADATRFQFEAKYSF